MAALGASGLRPEMGHEMPSLLSSDCRKLLALTGEIAAVGDAGSLPQHLLRGLRGLIPFEFGGCHMIEPSRHHIAACFEPSRSPLPTEHKEFWRLNQAHPLNKVAYLRHSRAWKLSDVISRNAFHHTEFYNALYRPLGVDCELVAALPDEQTPCAYLLISIHRSRRDFTERDRLVLNLILPEVAKTRRRLNELARDPGPAETAVAPLSEENAFRAWLKASTSWPLTHRECDVLFWLCQGKTNSEIGTILGIAERTAETHALHIYPKIGVENRYNAIATLTRMTSASSRT